MSKLDLTCLLHGEYQKFETDENKRCPYCLKEDAEAEEARQVAKTIFKIDGIVEVTTRCEEHGDIVLRVPSFLANNAHTCHLCIEEKRQKKLKKHFNRYLDGMYQEANIPESLRGCRFSDLDRSKSQKQSKIVERLCLYITDMVKKGESVGAKNILLTGNMGTGKTLCASIVLQNIMQRSFIDGIQSKDDIRTKGGLSCEFISEQELISEITATWSKDQSGNSSKKLYSRLVNKAVLCIDDVGTVTSMQTHLLDAYATIIDERYKRNLPTILTSNITHEGIKLAIGARSADRFLEKNKIIVANFDWGGYRTANAGTDEMELI